MTNEIDQRGIPTHQCLNCGGEWFKVYPRFEDYEIAQHIIEAVCVGCHRKFWTSNRYWWTLLRLKASK